LFVGVERKILFFSFFEQWFAWIGFIKITFVTFIRVPYAFSILLFRYLSSGRHKTEYFLSNFVFVVRYLSSGPIGGQVFLHHSKVCKVTNFNWPPVWPKLL
jgi:hypothetical protein